MAVCLDNGALCMFVLKDSSYEFFSLDKAEGVKCASWSPKGKQIAVACAGGKLAQYKPDLKLAKTIPCTVQLLPNPFAPIAIQWLSTFQFAVVLVEEKEEACPALFIVNAQKNIPPVYINYDDICYSQSGPRKSQVFMQHILPWNLILVGSANSSEIAILGTTDAGETPSWIQYIMVCTVYSECWPRRPNGRSQINCYFHRVTMPVPNYHCPLRKKTHFQLVSPWTQAQITTSSSTRSMCR